MTTFNQPEPDFHCTDWSLAIDEPMAGTAVSCQTWLFLEYNQPWLAKATNDNNLPKPIQAWLEDQVSQVNGRLQFIKQPRKERTSYAFFVAHFDETASRIYRFDLAKYHDLFALDLSAIIAGDTHYANCLTDEPQYMICTNGKRDVCCSLHGLALLRTLAKEVDTAVWETTHLGGHRFAATLLTLPDGVKYGRINPEDAPQLLNSVQSRSLWLEKLRGRVCYDVVTQAAEVFLRRKTAEYQLAAYTHLETSKITDENWRVQFQSSTNKKVTVLVDALPSLQTYPSSGQLKTKTFPQFHCSL